MNPELSALFQEDQADRRNRIDLADLAKRDERRRERVRELVSEGALVVAEDYYHAAMVFQHGNRLGEYWQAHELAMKSAEMGLSRGRWLAAAAYDRWLMIQGKPQKYGTQYRQVGGRYELYAVDPDTTDEERAKWNVPPLAEALGFAEELKVGDPFPNPNLIASLDVPGLRVEVCEREPVKAGEAPVLRPEPFDPEQDPAPAYLPAGMQLHRLGQGWAAYHERKGLAFSWFRIESWPGQPVIIAQAGEERPTLEPVATPAGQAIRWCRPPGQSSTLIIRTGDRTVWLVDATPPWQEELITVAVSLPSA